jgi:uncharacterized protein (TIGR03382 family)
MGFQGTGYLLALIVTGVWLAAVVVLLALLRARRTAATDVVCWICLGAQVAMLVRVAQTGPPAVAAVCVAALALGLLVRRRWAAHP